jgi:hypothetical protein
VSLLPKQIIDDLGLDVETAPRRYGSFTPAPDGKAGLLIDEIDAEVERFCAINKELIVIIHGGDAPSFVNHLKKGIFANENWTALGLWAMSQN